MPAESEVHAAVALDVEVAAHARGQGGAREHLLVRVQLAIGGRLGLATLRGANLRLRTGSGEGAATSRGCLWLVSRLLMGAREKVPGGMGGVVWRYGEGGGEKRVRAGSESSDAGGRRERLNPVGVEARAKGWGKHGLPKFPSDDSLKALCWTRPPEHRQYPLQCLGAIAPDGIADGHCRVVANLRVSKE